jgi:hypothetical protein
MARKKPSTEAIRPEPFPALLLLPVLLLLLPVLLLQLLLLLLSLLLLPPLQA